MRYSKTLSLAAMLGAFSMFAAAPAAAVYDCDSVVVDEAGWFSGDDMAKVEAAANNLINHGATVRVRTVFDDGGNGADNALEPYIEQIQQQCPSWRSADGGMRNNLIVFMAEHTNHDVTIKNGDLWEPSLGHGVKDLVRTESMNPHFRDGDFAEGFIAGIQRVDQMADLQLHPPKTNGPVVIDNRPAVDYSSTWGWTLALIAFILLVGGAFVLLIARNRANAARRTAQLAAKNARTACSNVINSFDPEVLKAKIKAAADISSQEGASALTAAFARVEAAFSSASAEYARLEEVSGNNPTKDGLSVSEYGQIGAVYAKLQKKLDAIEGERAKLEQEADKVRKNAQQAPQKMASAATAIAAANDDIATIEKRGYKTGAAQALASEAQKLLDQATKSANDKKPGAAVQLSDQASKKAAEASQAASQLPEGKVAIDAALDKLNQRIKAIEKNAANAQSVFAKLDEFVESSWSNIHGNGTEAEKRFEAASEAIRDATNAASMETQQWDEAQKLTAQATTLLGEAEELLASITQRYDALVDARKKAPAEIDAAQADIDKAEAYLRKYDEDIRDELEDDLKKAKRGLEEARAEAKKKQPDYILVIKKAIAANHAADAIFEAASGEHDAAERQRQRAVSLMEEANRSIDAAASYIRIHSSDVESGAKQRLQQAESYYSQARQARSLDERIGFAEKADNSADSALQKAQNDVQEEERRIRRRREEQQRSSNVVISSSNRRSTSWGSPSSSSHSSGSSSSGGFGHSSFGHSSSGGFGHSSGGHASSGKW